MARDPNGQDIHRNSMQCNGDLTRTPVPQEDEVAKLPTDFQISVSNHTFLRLIASTPDALSASESCSSAEISDSHILSNPPTLRESIYTHAHRSIRPKRFRTLEVYVTGLPSLEKKRQHTDLLIVHTHSRVRDYVNCIPGRKRRSRRVTERE